MIILHSTRQYAATQIPVEREKCIFILQPFSWKIGRKGDLHLLEHYKGMGYFSSQKGYMHISAAATVKCIFSFE